ncbi:MAG: hypothetical protein ABJN22_08410 [Litorimonas sp.]
MVDIHDGYRKLKVFYAGINHAAAVFDAPVGGPAVSPSGQTYPFYWIDPV